MTEKKMLQVLVSMKLDVELDKMVVQNGYLNKADLVRELLRKGLSSEVRP